MAKIPVFTKRRMIRRYLANKLGGMTLHSLLAEIGEPVPEEYSAEYIEWLDAVDNIHDWLIK